MLSGDKESFYKFSNLVYLYRCVISRQDQPNFVPKLAVVLKFLASVLLLGRLDAKMSGPLATVTCLKKNFSVIFAKKTDSNFPLPIHPMLTMERKKNG